MNAATRQRPRWERNADGTDTCPREDGTFLRRQRSGGSNYRYWVEDGTGWRLTRYSGSIAEAEGEVGKPPPPDRFSRRPPPPEPEPWDWPAADPRIAETLDLTACRSARELRIAARKSRPTGDYQVVEVLAGALYDLASAAPGDCPDRRHVGSEAFARLAPLPWNEVAP